MSLAIVRGKLEPDFEDFKTIERIADDCLPPNRYRVIKLLRERRKMRQVEIERAIGLPFSTCKRVLDDLEVLGITRSDGHDQNARYWELA